MTSIEDIELLLDLAETPDPDEATVIDLKDFLSEEGYQAQVVADASAAVEEIKRGRVQLVMLDVSPPADRPCELASPRLPGRAA